MKKYYDCGIDLGTTNSCIAIPNGNNGYEVLNNTSTNNQVTPSAVMRRIVKGEVRTVVGKDAYESPDFKNVARRFKRKLGTNQNFKFEKANEEWGPEELSTVVLKELISHASKRINKKLEDVVITVPAVFSIRECEATIRAGRAAGFRNVELLQEPIAAAIAYGMKPDTDNQYWLVFDFGGGTLDTALISTYNGRIRVLNFEGDAYLGGSDIDDVIVKDIILPAFREEEIEVNENNIIFMRKLQLEAEKCKIKLSEEGVSVSTFSACYDDDPRVYFDIHGDPLEFAYDITLQEYESAISPIINKAVEIVQKTLDHAKIPAKQLEKIILVGGSSFIPLVKRTLEEKFDIPVERDIDPMTVVAAGAAIYAGAYSSEITIASREPRDEYLEVKLSYPASTRNKNVNIKGVIVPLRQDKADEVKIDVYGNKEMGFQLSSTGWIKITNPDKGFFSTSVELGKDGLNYLQITARGEQGKILKLSENSISITLNREDKKLDSAPLNNSISVRVMDGKANVLDPIIRRNTPLPIRREMDYKTTKTFVPEENDKLEIEVYEGENFDYPPANTLIDRVVVSASEMRRKLEKDTKVTIRIEIDKNRECHFYGYIEDIDFEIPHQILRPSIYIEDLTVKLDDIDKKIESLYNCARSLDQKKGGSIWSKRMASLQKRFVDINSSADPDTGEMRRFIRDFYQFQTEVFRAEKEVEKVLKAKEREASVEKAQEYFFQKGTDADKEYICGLVEKYKKESNEELKERYHTQINDYKLTKQFEDFDWLKETLEILKAPVFSYTDNEKAAFWKNQGDRAVEEHSIANLQRVLLELLKLISQESRNSEDKDSQQRLADLRKI